MGFRSPTHRSLLTALCDFICQNTVPERLMYTDPQLKLQKSSGFIGDIARETIGSDLKSHLLRCLDDKNVFDYWLGRYLTIPLRMQLNKPKPFFLRNSSRRSLRSLFSEKGIGARLESPSIASNREKVGDDGTVSSILNGQSYEDDDEYLDDEDDEGELPYFLKGPHRVATETIFPDVDELLLQISQGRYDLRRVEGAKFAFIDSAIFVDGEAFEFPTGARFLGPLLCDSRVLTSAAILQSGMDLGPSTSAENQPRAFFCALLEAGYFYPCVAMGPESANC
jgi:hypothetical protein